jgi:glycosyltransferase involved in cell wall biosynthesis
MKILHLTVGHVPFDDRIFYKESIALAGSHEVILLAYSRDGLLKTMGGDVRESGVYSNVKVDVFTGKFSGRYLARLERAFGLTQRLLSKLKELDFVPDVIHCHEPESLRLAVAVKKHFNPNLKIIYDVHEFFFGYSFDKIPKYLSDIHFAYIRRSQKKLFKDVEATISVNEIVRSFNVVLNPNIQHLTVPNGYILPGDARRNDVEEEKFVLVHEGSLGFNRGLKFMLDIFQDGWVRANCKLKIVGHLKGKESDYFQELVQQDPDLGQSVEITGWIDYEKLGEFLYGSIGLIMMEPTVNNLLAGPPNKLFNYAWAGMPICSFDIPATSKYINDYGLGVVVARTQISFIQGIREIVENYPEFNSRVVAAREELSFKSHLSVISGLYNKLDRKP